jgi:hypothetical protein
MWKVLWRRLGRRAAGTGEAEPERPLLTVQVRAGDPPEPEDFKGRPLGDFLRALGVPEDTSQYGKGETRLTFRPGPWSRAPRDGEDA